MKKSTAIIFPNQLFEQSEMIDQCKDFVIVEEYLFFNQFKFHKQKILFHRISMKKYESYLLSRGKNVLYIDSFKKESDIRILIDQLNNVNEINIYDPVDDWLSRRILKHSKKTKIKLNIHKNPSFITSEDTLKSFFKSEKKKFFQTSFYKKQRIELNILINNGQPAGGKWTYDDLNREKYPKHKEAPKLKTFQKDEIRVNNESYINDYFKNNPGKIEKFIYPTDFKQAKQWFDDFLVNRFDEFGPYEDAVLKEKSILNHSVLSPLLNSGLISPNYVIEKSLHFYEKNNIRLNSCEGFLRQIIGWREFIRGVYIAVGNKERTRNFWNFNRKIPNSFYNGDTGIEPIDDTIKKINNSAYANHIERLMIIGNFMLLCEFEPNEVYKWFMEMFIDSYDWVMVPNVYGMSQFSDSGMMSTKPYISSSNYILKMSNYKKGDWCKIWDSLFWNFMDKQRDFFIKNPRMRMLVSSFDRMEESKRTSLLKTADEYLKTL